jgi:hypothetical protein
LFKNNTSGREPLRSLNFSNPEIGISIPINKTVPRCRRAVHDGKFTYCADYSHICLQYDKAFRCERAGGRLCAWPHRSHADVRLLGRDCVKFYEDERGELRRVSCIRWKGCKAVRSSMPAHVRRHGIGITVRACRRRVAAPCTRTRARGGRA